MGDGEESMLELDSEEDCRRRGGVDPVEEKEEARV